MKILKTIGVLVLSAALLALWFVLIRPAYTPVSEEWRGLVALVLGIFGGGVVGTIAGKVLILIWM